MPERDLGLAVDPAEIALLAVADGGEVDQATLEVAQDDLAPRQRAEAGLELNERLADLPAGAAAAVAGRTVGERLARLLVGQARVRVAHRLQPSAHPGQDVVGLLDRVMALVPHARIMTGAAAGSGDSRRTLRAWSSTA